MSLCWRAAAARWTKLTAYCSKALKTAEQKIVKLTAVEEATPAPDELVDRQGQDMGQALSE